MSLCSAVRLCILKGTSDSSSFAGTSGGKIVHLMFDTESFENFHSDKNVVGTTAIYSLKEASS